MVKYDQKFSIRKVTVGAASVVIGLAAGGAIVHAADVNEQPAHVQSVENANLGESVNLEKILEKAFPKEEKVPVPTDTTVAEEVAQPANEKDEGVTSEEKVAPSEAKSATKEENKEVSLNNENTTEKELTENKLVENSEIGYSSLRSVGLGEAVNSYLEDKKEKLLKELNTGVYYNYTTYNIPENKIKELTERIQNATYDLESIEKEINDQKTILKDRAELLNRIEYLNTNYKSELVEKANNSTTESELTHLSVIEYFIREMEYAKFGKVDEYARELLNGGDYSELRRKYGWEAENDLSYVKNKASNLSFNYNYELEKKFRDEVEKATSVEEVRELVKQAKGLQEKYEEVLKKINDIEGINTSFYTEKLRYADSIESLENILNEAVQDSKKDNNLANFKNELREKSYRLDNSRDYIEKIDKATTKEELDKISFDIEKEVFRDELNRDATPSTSYLYGTFEEKLDKVVTKEELSRLREEYEVEKVLISQRWDVYHYFQANLSEINLDEYLEKLNNAHSREEIQKVKELAKEKNDLYLNTRITREKQNIENVMNYIEPLTAEQKEYIKKEMTTLYDKEYANSKVEKEYNGFAIYVKKPVTKEGYEISGSELEKKLLKKIHYLYILNSDSPFFTKDDFATLREDILKSDSVVKFTPIVNKYSASRSLTRLENDEKEILKNRILSAKNKNVNSFESSREDLSDKKEQFINSLDNSKVLTKEEIAKYRKRLLEDVDFDDVKEEVSNLIQNREITNILPNLDEQDREKVTNFAKVDSKATLEFAKEYEKLNSYKNLTELDKQIFKSRIIYSPSNSNMIKPDKISNEETNASILNKLYTTDIPTSEKERLRDYIIKGEYLGRVLLNNYSLEGYANYYKNLKRIEDSKFSDESKKYLADKNNENKAKLDNDLAEDYKQAMSNDKILISKSTRVNNLDVKLTALEKLFSYSYISENKKLAFEKELISTENREELNNLRAMHRALNEMLEIQSTNTPTSPSNNNETPTSPENNKPAEPTKPTNNSSDVDKPTLPINNNISTNNNPTPNSENVVVLTKNLGDRNVEVVYDKGKVDADGLHLEKVEDANINKLIQDKLSENYNILEVFEIHFEKDNKEVKSDVERTVNVSLVESDGKIEVYHITDNNELNLVPSEVINGKVYFTTNHFSKFTIVQAKGEKSINKENIVLGVEYKSTNKENNSKSEVKNNKHIDKKQLPNTKATTNVLETSLAVMLLAGVALASRRKSKN